VLAVGIPLPAAAGPATLTEALLRAAETQPDRGLHLVRPDGDTLLLRYPELLARSRRVLDLLTAEGLCPGDRALLQVPDLEHYFPALWACLIGGILPVTVARPPGYQGPNPVLDKLCHAWESLAHPPVLSCGPAVEGLRSLPQHYPVAGLRVIPVDAASGSAPRPPGDRPAGRAAGGRRDAPALLRQYRSLQGHPDHPPRHHGVRRRSRSRGTDRAG
jgi:hypothetical protein